MVVKKKAVAKKPVVKKHRALSISKQIIATIFELCSNSNNELMVFEINESQSHALIVKNIAVTTFHIQNETSFCPVDKYTKKEFYTAFYVTWGKKVHDYVSIPEFIVKTPEEAKRVILSYDGETILD